MQSQIRAANRRFTPTRVGKTWAHRRACTAHAVHPHACGENQHGRAIGRGHPGSPPRVWGKRCLGAVAECNVRFTPTRVGKTSRHRLAGIGCAVHPHACGENGRRVFLAENTVRFTPTRVGKTMYPPALMLVPAVHPHACGENGLDANQQHEDGGSPPRVWGKRRSEADQGHARRFTPTRVGKTQWR